MIQDVVGAEILTSYTRWFECVTGSDGRAFGHLCIFVSFCERNRVQLPAFKPPTAPTAPGLFARFAQFSHARSFPCPEIAVDPDNRHLFGYYGPVGCSRYDSQGGNCSIAACISISEGKLAWKRPDVGMVGQFDSGISTPKGVRKGFRRGSLGKRHHPLPIRRRGNRPN